MPRFGGLLSAKCGGLRVSWATVADGVNNVFTAWTCHRYAYMHSRLLGFGKPLACSNHRATLCVMLWHKWLYTAS
jgi:hypothetical protein